MNTTNLVGIISLVITLICGLIAKKVKWFNNNLIPIQNLLIGITLAIVDYFITKDFSVAVSVSGLVAGGTYDIIHNLNKIDFNSLISGRLL